MNDLPYDIRLTYITALLIMMILVVFFVLIIFIYNKRQVRFINEKKLAEADHQNMMLQNEIDRQNMVHKERERISHDMHDDLGAGISALKLQAEFLKMKINDESLRQDIDELLNTTEEMNISMREMLWSLNSGNDNLENFVKYVIAYGEKFFSKTKIQFNFETNVVNLQIPISTEKRRNLYLAIKEVFNNCYKHSSAENVFIKFAEDNRIFVVEIIDDGKGFSKDICEGNGLKNMAYRMAEIGGTVKINNLDKGCKIIFTIDL